MISVKLNKNVKKSSCKHKYKLITRRLSLGSFVSLKEAAYLDLDRAF